MGLELGVVVVVIAFDRRFLKGSVHPRHLAIGPGGHFGQATGDAIVFAEAIEAMFEGKTVAFAIAELNPVIAQNRGDLVGHCRDQGTQELGGVDLPGSPVQFDTGEFGRAIDGDEEVDVPFSSAYLGNVDVAVTDRVALEGAPGFCAFILGQATDAMALQAAVQRRAGRFRDARLEGEQAIIQRQQGGKPRRPRRLSR